MADLEKTVAIIFSGIDDLSGPLNSMSKKMDSFGNGLEDFGAPFADATEKILVMNAAIAAIAVAGITASADIESESKKMAASLGLPTAEAERFKEIAESVYTAGFGDDLAAAFESVTLAQKRFGDETDISLENVAEQSLKIQKIFEVDLNESMGAVKTLMDNFGLSANESFAFITAGFQEGLNGSNDFIDSINEYSTQFSNGGADASQFFSVLQSGFQEGMLGTDRAADMFKEFRVRIQDESTTTREALESIGIDPVAFEANMASGKMSAVDAFNIIQEKLNATTDKSVQLNAGVGLMGTQFEDMGTKAALAINTTSASISDMEDRLNTLDTDTFTKNFTSALRTVTTEFGNMEQWETAKAKIADVFGDIAASFGPALDNVDFSGLEDSIGEVWDKLQSVFSDADFDFSSVEGMQNVIQTVVDTVGSLVDVTSGMVDAFEPFFDMAVSLTNTFNSLDPDIKEVTGSILAMGTALVGIGGTVKVGGVLLSGLTSLTGTMSSGGPLATAVAATIALLAGPAGLAIGIGSLSAAVLGFTTKTMNDELDAARAAMEAAHQATMDLYTQITDLPANASTIEIYAAVDRGDLDLAQSMIDELTSQEHTAKIKAEAEQAELNQFFDKWDGISDEKEVELTAAINEGDFDRVNEIITGLTDPKTVDITAKADVEKAKEELEWFDNEGNRHTMLVDVETENVEKAKEEIEEIPTEKQLEIILQGEIDTQIQQIISSAEVAQSAMEWSAKVDIAEAEAAAETTKAAFDSVGESVSAVSGTIGSMFSSLAGNMDSLSDFDQNVLMREMDKQTEEQSKLIESQISLNESQIKYMDARTEAMERGDSQIEISYDGIEPALEMVMWKIIEKVQIKANENASDFLLGIT